MAAVVWTKWMGTSATADRAIQDPLVKSMMTIAIPILACTEARAQMESTVLRAIVRERAIPGRPARPISMIALPITVRMAQLAWTTLDSTRVHALRVGLAKTARPTSTIAHQTLASTAESAPME